MNEAVTFALAAGALAAVNPCGFVMLPAYLTLFIAGNAERPDEHRDALANLARAVMATVAMTAGFLLVFGAFGLALGPIASTVQRWLPVVTVVVGAALVLLGVVMLTGRKILVNLPTMSGGDPVAGFRSMFLYGVSYAVASLGCTIGPFLVVTATTFKSGEWTSGVVSYAAYAAGMGLVVGVLSVMAALAQDTAAGLLRRLLPHVERIGGVLLIVAGGYVGWYGIYELRVYAGGPADDPVVESAGRLQNVLSQWVDRVGPLGFAAVMLVLIVGTVALSRFRRRVSRS